MSGMTKVRIAFDVDGTLIRNDSGGDMDQGPPIANERIRTMLISFASMKNTHIIVWSGGGELYARQVSNSIGISKYVDQYASKNLIGKHPDGSYMFRPDIPRPDIAIDDIQETSLGLLNIIVREK